MDSIVLDAMGVVFRSADDVAELLIPFILDHGREKKENIINAAYIAASLGTISADEFWHQVGIEPELEDLYLSRHKISDGLIEFLVTANEMNIPVWLLSNDVVRWSKKLRHSFDIDQYFQGTVISGDVRSRKPDTAIYHRLVERSGFSPEKIVFFDDRQKNVSAAQDLGIPSKLFDTVKGFSHLTEQLRTGAL